MTHLTDHEHPEAKGGGDSFLFVRCHPLSKKAWLTRAAAEGKSLSEWVNITLNAAITKPETKQRKE